jgi:hypothetical protein
MSRKIFLVTISLFSLAALRYCFGQDDTSGIGWDPITVYDPIEDVFTVMLLAPIVGLVLGALRVAMPRSPVLQPIRL